MLASISDENVRQLPRCLDVALDDHVVDVFVIGERPVSATFCRLSQAPGPGNNSRIVPGIQRACRSARTASRRASHAGSLYRKQSTAARGRAGPHDRAALSAGKWQGAVSTTATSRV
jgi:hypothetical protein